MRWIGAVCEEIPGILESLLHMVGRMAVKLIGFVWKTGIRFLSRLWRRPKQALIEAIVFFVVAAWAMQWARTWIEQHRLLAGCGIGGILLLMVLFATIDSRTRRGRKFKVRRRR